jgi:hypothetical protein
VKYELGRRSLLPLLTTSTKARVAFYKVCLHFNTTHNLFRSINSHREAMSNIDWKRCAACLENFDEAARKRWWVDCNHVYCTDCITSLFRPSLAGGPFPPQCCGQVISCWTHEELKAVLPEDLNSQLAKKKEEFDTSDRTYCSVPTCSTFVGAPHITGNDAKCPACEYVTCVACKAPTHDGECPTDETLEEVLHIAETAGGKRCEKCGSMIERMEGCDEMV